jgi:rhomboid protease GluP
MNQDRQAIAVVRETLLSKKPRPGALWVALASLLLIAFVSLVSWRESPLRLAATRESVFVQGEYGRLLSSMAVHADERHLVVNGAVLGLLTYLVYGYFGAASYPLLGVVLGAIAMGLTLQTYPPDVALLGASGLVYLLAAFWLTSFVLIERRLSPMKRLLRATGFALVTLVPTSFDPHVSYRAHAIGFGLGLVWGLAHFAARRDEIRQEERVELD